MKKTLRFFAMAVFAMIASSAFAEDVIVGDFTFTVNGDQALVKSYNGTATEVTVPAAVNEIGVVGFAEGAFEGNTTVEKILLSNDAKQTVEARAFKGCTALTTLAWTDESGASTANTISNSANQIVMIGVEFGESAFEGCTSITNVKSRYSNTAISKNMFKDCTSLKSINPGQSCTAIGEGAFEGCTSLTTFQAFTTSYTKLTEIGARAFFGCAELTSFPKVELLETIGESAFEGCEKMKTVSKGASCKSLTNIGNRAFYGCKSLNHLGNPTTTSIMFCANPNLATIGNEAFAMCTSITRLANNRNIESIGEGAFSGCTSLADFGNQFIGCESIPADAFDGCPATEVKVGTTGFATLTPTKIPFDFSDNANFKAYKASISGTDITLSKVETVAVGEGVLLYAEGGAEEFVPVKGGTVSKNDGNAFVGVTEDIEALASEDNGTNYILNDGVNGVGFYLAADKAVAAGKAYLKVPAEGAKNFYTLTIVDDEMTTGISEVKANALLKDVIYSISGQRVGDNYKGVVIVNGKKVLKK